MAETKQPAAFPRRRHPPKIARKQPPRRPLPVERGPIRHVEKDASAWRLADGFYVRRSLVMFKG